MDQVANATHIHQHLIRPLILKHSAQLSNHPLCTRRFVPPAIMAASQQSVNAAAKDFRAGVAA